MTTTARILVALAALLSVISGCVPTPTFVKDFKVSAPRLQQPILLTPDSISYSHQFIASVSQFSDSPLHASIGEKLYGAGRNLDWSVPKYCFSVFYERPLSPMFAGFAGLSYSSTSGDNLGVLTIGASAFLTKKILAIRLDASSQVCTYTHHAQLAQIIGESGPVPWTREIDFESSGTRLAYEWNASLTVNTNFRSSPVNAFIQFTSGTQTLASLSVKPPPSAPDNNGVFLHVAGNTFNVTPGMSFNVNRESILSIGVQFIGYTGIVELTKTRFVSPLIQYSIRIE